MTARVLDVVDLSITYDGIAAVRDVSFHIDAGEVVALIGRSGAGKSSIISAIMDLLPPHAVVGGSFHVSGHTRADVDGGMWRNRMVGLVPQNPFSWFNPMIRLHKQLAETMGSDYARDRRERRRHADALLRQVGFVDTKRIARARPHELSGGMRQRAAIAAALTHRPPLVLADEPTSALDPESQSQILELLAECRAFGQAVLLVSHEAAVVERLANRVLYLDNGVLVDEMARNTLELTSRPSIMDEVVVMQARRLAVSYPHVPIVHDFDFGIRRGETVALVGESGSGKSTLCRIFGGFGSPEVGEVVFDGTPVQMLSRRDRANMVQTVFQDVRGSLDSRLTARRCVELSLEATVLSDDDFDNRVRWAFAVAGVDECLWHRTCDALSGGEAQRVAVARAIAARPKVLLLDEPFSALDTATRNTLIERLIAMQDEFGTAIVAVLHNHDVVEGFAHREIHL